MNAQGAGPSGAAQSNSMLGGMGMSPMVGTDQAAMGQRGWQSMMSNVGQSMMANGMDGMASGVANGLDARNADMLRFGADPARQARSAEAIAGTPEMLRPNGAGFQAPSAWQPAPMYGLPAPSYGTPGSTSMPDLRQTLLGMQGAVGMPDPSSNRVAGAGLGQSLLPGGGITATAPPPNEYDFTPNPGLVSNPGLTNAGGGGGARMGGGFGGGGMQQPSILDLMRMMSGGGNRF